MYYGVYVCVHTHMYVNTDVCVHLCVHVLMVQSGQQMAITLQLIPESVPLS